MHTLLVEQSDENVRLDSIDAVKAAAAASKERAVVDRFMMAGAVSIIAAEGGCGKTALLYAISEAISNGSPLFGQLPTIKGHVVIIEADESWRNSAEKYGLGWTTHQTKTTFTPSGLGIRQSSWSLNRRSRNTTPLQC